MTDLTPGQARVLRSYRLHMAAEQEVTAAVAIATLDEFAGLNDNGFIRPRLALPTPAGLEALRAYEEEGNDG